MRTASPLREDDAVGELGPSFLRFMREAAKPYERNGWRARGAGLVLHAPDGCWGQIVFSGARRKRPTLEMGLTAGACAPYLMRVVNKLDPAKPPTPNFVAAHTRTTWEVPVTLVATSPRLPEPFDLDPSNRSGPFELSLASAPAWLGHTLAQLVPGTQALSSNRAILDWLAAPRERESTFAIRYAILLARHLGLEERLPDLERRAEEHYRRDFASRSEQDTRAADRQRTYPQDWSHARFMQFVAATPA